MISAYMIHLDDLYPYLFSNVFLFLITVFYRVKQRIVVIYILFVMYFLSSKGVVTIFLTQILLYTLALFEISNPLLVHNITFAKLAVEI